MSHLSKVVTVRVPNTLLRRLAAYLELSGRRRNEVLLEAIREWLERRT